MRRGLLGRPWARNIVAGARVPTPLVIQELRHPPEAASAAHCDGSVGVRSWNPRIPPNPNMLTVADAPNEALLEEFQATWTKHFLQKPYPQESH